MMTLKCMDLGKDCHFEARGDSKDEVMKNMMEHVKVAHPELLEVSDDEMKEMETKMMSMIKEE